MSGSSSHRLRIATSFSQSETKGEVPSATQVPSEQEASSKSAPGASLPGMVSRAPATSQSAVDPEIVIISAPSAAESSFTAKVKSAVPELAPGAMTIWKGSGRAAVKSCPAPSVASPGAEPPAAVTATVTGAPAGAVCPVGRAAVTVIVVEAEPSSATLGEADSVTADSSSTMVRGGAEITLKAAAVPEKITDLAPSRARSSAGVNVKSV